jgi:hypothetical protein
VHTCRVHVLKISATLRHFCLLFHPFKAVLACGIIHPSSPAHHGFSLLTRT